MKRIIKAAACFLPLLLLVMGINWYSDPGNVIRDDYEQKVAEIMARGENAANLANMDDRALMRCYLPLRTQPIDTLVLGSSHSMQLSADVTGDPNTFCGGMTGADMRDCISLYELARENGFSPKRVVLVLDSWFISEGVQEKRAMTEGYLAFCDEEGLTAIQTDDNQLLQQKLEKKLQIFSVPYFQSSLNYLMSGQIAMRDPVATTQFFAESNMRRADGSYGYGVYYRTPDSGYLRQNLQDVKQLMPEFARNFDGISDQLLTQLKAFVRRMKQDGCEVALMLTPFHPEFYEVMARENSGYEGVLQTEQVFRALASELDVPLAGSYDPAECGLTENDFYDSMHCTSEAMHTLYPDDLFS